MCYNTIYTQYSAHYIWGKKRLGLFADFSEVTWLELNCRLSNTQARVRSTRTLFDLTPKCFVPASLSAIHSVLECGPSLKTCSIFWGSLRSLSGRRTLYNLLFPCHSYSVPLHGSCHGSTASSWVSVFPTGSPVNQVSATSRDTNEYPSMSTNI